MKRTLLKRRKGLSRGLRLKKVSFGRRKRLAAYYALVGAFLKQPPISEPELETHVRIDPACAGKEMTTGNPNPIAAKSIVALRMTEPPVSINSAR